MRRWIVGGVLGASLAACATLAARIADYPTALAPGSTHDAAIVLGAAISGVVPSPVFAGRLRYGADLIQSGSVRQLIVTGGVGAGKRLSEAEVGRRFLIGLGVNPDRIILEAASHTTFENLCFAAILGRAHGFRSYAIVSDALHLRRALLFAHDAGLHAEPAATPYTRYVGQVARARFLLRESYFYARRLSLGKTPCSVPRP